MQKRIIILLIIIITIILVGIAIFFGFKSYHFKLTSNLDAVLLNEDYEIPSFSAEIFNKDLSKYVDITSEIDNKVIGEYKIDYKLKWLFIKDAISIKVKVIDNISPIISLLGKDNITIYVGDKYKEEGVTITDNYDSNLKPEITSDIDVNKVGDYLVNYTAKDSSGNTASVSRKVKVIKKIVVPQIIVTDNNKWYQNIIEGPTYIKGILLVNKKYKLPSTFNPGVDVTANAALNEMFSAAKNEGYIMKLISGFRSYNTQVSLYNNKLKTRTREDVDKTNARPGHSEHQSGLAFDIDSLSSNYINTPNGKWLSTHAHLYGFIIRYPKDKTSITGYSYEPWHIRYVGVEHATYMYNNNLCLEEYLGV